MENQIALAIHCTDFPGRSFGEYQEIRLGLPRGKVIVESVPGDAQQATFTVPLTVRLREGDLPDFAGPFVHGRRGERFIYLTWTTAAAPDTPFRRIKLPLRDLPLDGLADGKLEAHVRLTDPKGAPVAATLSPRNLRWERPQNP
jgi:hypothetical protein